MVREKDETRIAKPINVSSAAPCHRDDLATLLLLTPRHVGKLAERGILRRHSSGRFDLVPAVQGYIQHLRKANGFGDELGNAAEHKLRLLKAKADLADMEAKKAAGEYIAVDEVERTWADIVTRFRQRTLHIAHRAAPLVAVESSATACHKTIDALIHQALTELASTQVEAAPDDT